MKHKTYMYRQGGGWIVCSWDDKAKCYRTSGELQHAIARAAVGTDNCRNPGNCNKQTHQHLAR